MSHPLEQALPPRTGDPVAKAYDPAETIGDGTVPIYRHMPKYSFGGGKSRLYEEEREKKNRDLVEGKMGTGISPARKPTMAKSNSAPQKLELKKRKVLNRGFGSACRLQLRGGPMELPISPGPAAYEVPRECDLVPGWSSSTLVPWGRRTAPRANVAKVTATDAGPGEYTADHGFQCTSPCHQFGIRLTEPITDNFPGAGTYPSKSYICDGPEFSLGARSALQEPPQMGREGPGPGAHQPRMESVYPHTASAVFGTGPQNETYPEVDPDEPPGPGYYSLLKRYTAKDRPSAGLPQAPRGDALGLGPQGLPGPGEYPLPREKQRGGVMGVPLKPGKVDNPPGPGYYTYSDHLTRPSVAGCKSLHHKEARGSLFNFKQSATEKATEAMLQECTAEVGPQTDAKNAIAFAPSGPSFSFGARRPGPESRYTRFDVPFISQVNSVG